MEDKKEVIIKILPLPIPIGTPVATPVHTAVPAAAPFVSSQFGSYSSLPLLNEQGLVPRMDKGEEEQIGTRRSADPDHSLIGGHSDSHTHTTHHLTHTTHEQPSCKGYKYCSFTQNYSHCH